VKVAAKAKQQLQAKGKKGKSQFTADKDSDPALTGDLKCTSRMSWQVVCTYCASNLLDIIRGGHLRPQTGVVLKCELSMVAKTDNKQAQFPEVLLLIALELECCRFWQKCLIACGVNPIFHHTISIAGHPHYQIT
jgi:hypothetical protein